MGNKKSKVLLIGWDAADWKIIDKLMANGLMPAMKSLVDNGVRGKLATLDPPLSPMLWTSMATGVRPYRHGVIGFVEHDGKGGVRSVSSHYRKVKAFWNMMTMEGYKSNVIAWWPSNPVESINGCMVSNLFQQEKKGRETMDLDNWEIPEGTIYPESLKEQLMELRVHPHEITGNLVMPFVPQAVALDKKKDKRLTVISKFIAHATTVHAACTELMETQEWDLTAVYHDAIDHFSHGFMKFHPPMMPNRDKEEYELFKDVVIGAYVFHDMMLDRLLKMIDDDTTVIIVSDHGFHSDHLRPLHIPKVPSGPAIEHAPYGIFVAKGPGIKKGERIHGASVLDVTPTLLTLFDLPVGRDMDGKPLVNIFDHPKSVRYIDSWENVDKPGGELVSVSEESLEATNEAALQQLVDLGYIDEMKLEDSNEDHQEYLKGIIKENQFYLAKSYISGGKHEEAIEILLEIEDKSNPDFRFLIDIINSAIKTKRYPLAKEYLSYVRKNELMSEAYMDTLDAKIALGLNDGETALQMLKSAIKSKPDAIEILIELGRLFNSLRELTKARDCFLKVIDKDPDNAHAYHGAGVSFLREENYEDALDYFFQAVEKMHHYPMAHFHIGETLALMKEYQAALASFELALTMKPDLPKTYRWLIDLNEILENQKAAEFYKTKLNSKIVDEKVIITGLPGEKLMSVINFLREKGFVIKGDPINEAQWANPLNNDILEGVEEHICYLPENMIQNLLAKYDCRFVVVNDEAENVSEFIHSQARMKKLSFNADLIDGLIKMDKTARIWLGQQPNLDLFYVNNLDESKSELLISFVKN